MAGAQIKVTVRDLGVTRALERVSMVTRLRELMADPFEIWASFAQDRATGQVGLRQCIIKVVADPVGHERGLLVVAQASRGVLVAVTFLPTTRLDYLAWQRVGRLVWARGGT
jgi:hypothetical protein